MNRARKLFERACTGNSSYGCRRYADVWFRGIGDGGANAGTSRLYDRKACELGSTWGCGDACGEGPACLTRARSNEEAGRPDKAIDSYSHLCVVGIAEACFHASRVYEEGIGRPPDPVGALVFQKMGCDKGYPRSCVPLARMLDERGKHDEATAKLEKGCADDGEESCHALAVRYAGGEHLPADPAKAVELFNTACEHEVAESCHALAELHAEGRGVPKSPAQAKAFHARACKLGYQASCPPAPSTFAPR
ncbi:MAG: tetratricopeptide repeat protein [Polyangiaceae bacterium]